jgi:hypothetical protein
MLWASAQIECSRLEFAIEESEGVAGLVAVDRRDMFRHFHLTEQKEAKGEYDPIIWQL